MFLLRDRPFNLQGGRGGYVFLFRSEIYFRTTRELEYLFSAVRIPNLWARVRIFSHCMTSYNFEANAIFVIFLALKNSLIHTHEKWTLPVSQFCLYGFTIIVYYCIKLSMHFSEDMWIKGWDINVKGKQFHILFYLFILLLFPR
jgi:hypothetical protein